MKHWVVAAVIGAGAMSAGVTPALAQNNNPDFCAMISSASERLQCYDGIFRPDTFAGSVEGIPDPDQGLWASGVEVSQIEGTELPFATLQSEQLIPALPRGRAPARLAILCVDGETAVQFSFAGNTLGTPTSNTGTITLQFDRNPPRSQSLELSADREALGFFTDTDAMAFIDRLLVTQRLFVRALPQGQRSVTVSFDLEGIETAVEPVSDACGW